MSREIQMIDWKSNIGRVEQPEESGSTSTEAQNPSANDKGKSLLREIDFLCEYYSIGLDESRMSTELSNLVAEAVQRFPDDKEQALTSLVRELHQVDDIIDKYHENKESLIQILLDINTIYHWLPKTALLWVSMRLDVPLSRRLRISRGI